jgi:hypothetical protein
MQIGVDSFAAAISDPATGLTLSPVERMRHLLEEIEIADKVGLDVFGIGEHHRAEFLDSAPVVILYGLVDGDHYFDTIAEDAFFEFRYHFPGWPMTIRGRANLMASFSGYGKTIKLHSGDTLVCASFSG